MESQYFFNLIYFFGLLITFVSSQCPFGSSSNSGTCDCLPGYTSTGSGSSLVCTSICPVGSNCVVISKRTTLTGNEEVLNLIEVELYLGTTKLLSSSLDFSMSSSWGDSSPASNCNNGVTSPSTHENSCHTAAGDQNAWILINAGLQIFSKIIVYNRIDGGHQDRINIATLTMFNGATIINPAVTFSSFGSSLDTYTFYSIGFLCPTGSNCVVISKITTSGDEYIGLREVELYMGTSKLAISSLAFSMSSTLSDASISWSASICNDGLISSSTEPFMCHTATGDRNAWLLINAGSQSFSRVVVYNQMDVLHRINIATLTMFNGRTVSKPAVTFSSLGSSLDDYTFCSTGFTGSNCVSSCLSNFYYNSLNNSCTGCPSGSTSTAGSAVSCDCAINYASSGYGSSLVCTACPEGSSSNAGGSSCTCTPGYYNSHIANLNSQITSLNNVMLSINSSIANPQMNTLNTEINQIKSNFTNQNTEVARLSTEIIGIKSNITNQISLHNDRLNTMNTEIIGIKSNITDRINNDILPEISKIKLSLQKLTATLNKLRKRDRSKKHTEL